MSEQNEQNKTFNYTYSAAQRKEIEAIRKKYDKSSQSIELDKMEQLRTLDRSATKNASIWALTVGIIGALILGSGMSLIMTDIGQAIGISHTFVLGTAIGIVGMIGVIAAYPLYQRIVAKQRRKIAPQILKLTDELSEK